MNRVVDSASIEVNRRSRRTKTDRIDARKLVQMLVRACLGEEGVWREVHVPAVEAEAARHVSRERSELVAEQTRLTNQVQSLLTTYGAEVPNHRRGAWWRTVRDWAGAALPAEVQARVARLATHRAVVASRLTEVDAAQQQRRQAASGAGAQRQLVRLKGIATTSASVLVDEGLVWRAFRNRRQVGGFVGFRPVPYGQWRAGPRSGHRSGRQSAAPRGEHSAGVELGAVATAQRADALVYPLFCAAGCARPAHRHRGAGPQAPDRVVAVRHQGRCP